VIVVDSNVIAYLLIPGDQTAAAREVLRHEPVWAAPVLWRSEFRNVLALYVRQKHFSLAAALSYMQEAEILLRGRDFEVESAPVLTLAEQSGRSGYDCEFVYLAQMLGLPLVTSDRQLLRSFPGVAISMDDFVA
jgi:predicted nucleic acid-binding protein